MQEPYVCSRILISIQCGELSLRVQVSPSERGHLNMSIYHYPVQHKREYDSTEKYNFPTLHLLSSTASQLNKWRDRNFFFLPRHYPPRTTITFQTNDSSYLLREIFRTHYLMQYIDFKALRLPYCTYSPSKNKSLRVSKYRNTYSIHVQRTIEFKTVRLSSLLGS